MKKLAIAIVVALAFVLVACGNENLGYKDVSTEEAKQLIDDNEVVILDVRTEEEYKEGHIPNSILIPISEIVDKMDELDKAEQYLVVCRSGNRSTQASELLSKNGFAHILNMEKGMNSWTYEIEQ